ncbi:MAG: DUF4396 domain-containing protein [Pseudomonadota bacterium]
MLAGTMLIWFLLTAGSVAFVVWDSVTNGVTSWVQRTAWILVTLYTGPVGLFVYLLTCRRPFPGAHDEYTRPVWKQGVNSEMHCLAGDATGIIVAASIVPVFGLANGWDITIEYLAAFVSGLFIFQALMMAPMFGGHYFTAVRKTFFAETVSMNMVMVGMIPTMVILAAVWEGSENPLAASFWFRMSLATIVGGIIAFPINRWMVKAHLKHGCMTLPGADAPAHGLGHRSPEAMEMGGDHHTHDMGHDHGGMEMDMGGMDMSHHHDHGMQMNSLPFATALAWIVGTFLLLFAALWATSQFVPITFTVSDAVAETIESLEERALDEAERLGEEIEETLEGVRPDTAESGLER